MDPIEAAITAIESRESGETFSYRQIAKEFGVVVSTLTRRH
jgi:transposase